MPETRPWNYDDYRRWREFYECGGWQGELLHEYRPTHCGNCMTRRGERYEPCSKCGEMPGMNEWDWAKHCIEQVRKKCGKFSDDSYFDEKQRAAWERLGEKLAEAIDVSVNYQEFQKAPY